MAQILFLQGLPGSGKTFLAKALIDSNLSFKRINKDDIRDKIPNYSYSKDNEEKVLQLERSKGINYLKSGYNLVIDDCNFNPKHLDFWSKYAQSNGHTIIIKYLDVPIDVCIERDSKRDKPVGAKVIEDMFNTYIKNTYIKHDDRFIIEENTELPPAYIFDIDGTLALITNRSPYDDILAINDRINPMVVKLLHKLSKDFTIIIVTGRQDRALQVTKEWLNLHNIPYNHLYMRATGDNRNDNIVKEEIYENNIRDKYSIWGVFDDRNSVVDMWRSKGLTCFQVYYGDF